MSVTAWPCSKAECATWTRPFYMQPVLLLDVSRYKRLCCPWMCLSYSSLCCILDVPGICYKKTVLPLDVSVLQQPLLHFGRICYTEDCAASERVCPAAALCCCLWTCLSHSSLCCLSTLLLTAVCACCPWTSLPGGVWPTAAVERRRGWCRMDRSRGRLL